MRSERWSEKPKDNGSIPFGGTNYGFIVSTASTSVSKTESWGSNPHGPAMCGISSAGRASALQAGGQWFESTIPHHYMPRSPSGLRQLPSKQSFTGSNPVRGTNYLEVFYEDKSRA